MDNNQRLQLQKMISENNVEDQTNLIRNLKHSDKFKTEINNMIMIKAKYRNDPERINKECMNECNFLFTYYTDLYNKIKKDEINLMILNNFINILKQIEDGELDQHQGAFKVGTILKELYIDSAIKKGDKLDELNEKNNPIKPKQEPKIISWNTFKTKINK